MIPKRLDTIEMAPAVVPSEPDTPVEDVMCPALPAGVAELLNARATEVLTVPGVRSKLRATAMLSLRTQGYSYKEIAEMVGVSLDTVRVSLSRARRAGRLNDLRAILENDTAARAVENLNELLDKGDKEATFKTLDGLGHFKKYSNNPLGGGPAFTMPALTVTVINAPNVAGQQQVVSLPVGAPREDKAE